MYDLWRKQSAKNMEVIDDFADRASLVKRVIPVLGKKIIVLDLACALPIDPGRVNGYAISHLDALGLRGGIGNNCFDIAEAARNAGRTTGTMHADSGTEKLVGWCNHCINFDMLRDGTAVAIDLTASRNIDQQQGGLDILALRVPNTAELTLQVGRLFGGEWEIDQ